jgi:hypothetical protein
LLNIQTLSIDSVHFQSKFSFNVATEFIHQSTWYYSHFIQTSFDMIMPFLGRTYQAQNHGIVMPKHV